MNINKLRVGVLFGGKSAEHEISLLSAQSIIEALDPDKYEITRIGIDKQGHWVLLDATTGMLHTDDPKRIALRGGGTQVSMMTKENRPCLIPMNATEKSHTLDVIFPILHGTYGEDGTVQGLLKLLGIPFVGAGVLGSAVGMDKDVMKRLLRDAAIPTAKFRVLRKHERHSISFEEVVKEIGLPCFVKPANLGSSVGITKVKSLEDWDKALDLGFMYDHKLLVEEAIEGREIECSVLGNEDPIASIPGELIPTHEFYSYEAKYLDENGALIVIPAALFEEEVKRIQKLAIDAYKVLCCEGMARVDFFLTNQGEIKVNEINTLPGFTKISMYPKMWQASGLSYPALLDRLIELAIDRHRKDSTLKTTLP